MTADLEASGSIPLAALAVGLLAAAAWNLGGWLVPRTRSVERQRFETSMLRFAVGLTLTGLLGVTLGQIGLLSGSRGLWLVVGLAVLALIPIVRRLSRDASVGSVQHRPGVGLTLVLFLTLGPALCYPTGWDELVYHHVLPRRWLTDGRPAFYPDLPYSGFPSLGEILFWLVAPLESLIVPRLLNWVCWTVGLLLLNRLLRRRIRRGAAEILTCVFALGSAVLMISANCYVESILLMQFAALLLVLSNVRRFSETDRQWRFPVLLGVLAGGAAAVKLTGLAIIVVPLLWFLCAAGRDSDRWKWAARSCVLCIGTAAVMASPFYLRPWLATGNPFYPYFCEWFTSDPIRVEMSQFHHAIGGSKFGVRSLATFFNAPILLAFEGQLYDGAFGWQWLGILALAVLALLSIRRRRIRSDLIGLAVTSLWLYTFWYLTAQQARFAVPFFLPVVLLAGRGLKLLRGPTRALVLGLLIVAAAISFPWRTMGYYFGSWETVFGYWSWAEYVDDGTDYRYLPLVKAVEEGTPADARLMLLFEHRSLYLPRPASLGTPLFQDANFSPAAEFAQPERIVALLTQSQITHLVLMRSPIGPDQVPDWLDRVEPVVRGLEASLRQGDLKIVWESPDYLVLGVARGED